MDEVPDSPEPVAAVPPIERGPADAPPADPVAEPSVAEPSVAEASVAEDPPTADLVSRRGVLLTVAGVVVAGGAGAAVAAVRAHPTDGHPSTPPPAVLVAALASERELIAALRKANTAQPALRPVLAQLLADHRAHEQALVATLTRYPGASTAGGTPTPATPRTAAAVRAAEQTASGNAAARARALTGADATLLASIAACETAHTELLA